MFWNRKQKKFKNLEDYTIDRELLAKEEELMERETWMDIQERFLKVKMEAVEKKESEVMADFRESLEENKNLKAKNVELTYHNKHLFEKCSDLDKINERLLKALEK